MEPAPAPDFFVSLQKFSEASVGARDTVYSFFQLYARITECLRLRRHVTILENGTGSGAFAEVLAQSVPGAQILAVDDSLDPSKLSTPPNSRVSFYESDLTRPQAVQELNTFYDLVVDGAANKKGRRLAVLDACAPFLKPGGMYVMEGVTGADVEFDRVFLEAIAYKYQLRVMYLDMHQKFVPNDNAVIFVRDSYGPIVNSHAVILSVESPSSPPRAARKPRIFVPGLQGCGLGNCMFQVAAAVALLDTGAYAGIFLDSSSPSLNFGTAAQPDRDRRKLDSQTQQPLSYLTTVFATPVLQPTEEAIPGDAVNLTGNYTGTFFPELETVKHSDVVLRGYFQHRDYFVALGDRLLTAFNLSDDATKAAVEARYPVKEYANVAMVGVRACADFKHMRALSKATYHAALQHLFPYVPASQCAVLVLADVKGGDVSEWFEAPPGVAHWVVDEDDVTQLYAAQLCNAFVVGESSFHYWAALLKYLREPATTQVLCFRDTDITERNLHFPDWIVMAPTPGISQALSALYASAPPVFATRPLTASDVSLASSYFS